MSFTQTEVLRLREDRRAAREEKMFANFTATTRFDRKNDQRLTEVIEAVAELFDKQKRAQDLITKLRSCWLIQMS